MMYDFELVKKFYDGLEKRMTAIRKRLGRPLALSEKILYNHLASDQRLYNFRRGTDYADFSPDRVAMQDATAQMTLLQFILAGMEKSAVPASVHCDHLIMARSGAGPDLENALSVNREVYDFLGSACNKYDIDFWEPGSGIIHQIILENYAFPGGMMIGTDSHTVNAGGMGMLAIGTGGADAVDVMSGMGWELKFPGLTGIKLTGKLNGWTSAKDVILKIAGLLTVKGATGSILEYFGEGAESLSCTGKATICNMGAEVGATCSVFGYDQAVSAYLYATGRSVVAEMADKLKEHLTADPEVNNDPEKYFDSVIEINLSDLEPHINGPFTPDLATPVSKMKEMAEKNGWPVRVEAALIGSCTNSSYQDLSRAASVIRDAIEKKLTIKTIFTITPGSEQIRKISERDGLFEVFEKAGGKVFANACGPCIGQWEREGAGNKPANTIIHSFNRNFAKRADGNPNTHAFVASPEIVTALAIAGDLTFNPVTDYLVNSENQKVMLDIPHGTDLPPNGYNEVLQVNKKFTGDKDGLTVKIDPLSDRLQVLEPFNPWDGKDFEDLPLLIKVRGKCTTDHISMAGSWLKYRGHLDHISDNYMIGAVNCFNGQTNNVLNQITRNYEPVPQVARYYKSLNLGSVVIGEENFGEGSSREHAAMEPRYLNVKAVIVKSFARIHETNLKKQGILALTFSDKEDYEKIRESDKISIPGLNEFSPGKKLKILLAHTDGTDESISADHTYNKSQIEWFRAGSALNMIRGKKQPEEKN
jgi:aconitate hydratase